MHPATRLGTDAYDAYTRRVPMLVALARMNVLAFTAVVAAASLVAGTVGALTGLGGGVVIIPLLVLVFGVDIRYAIGASLVSVIATSSGAASAYVREGFSNIRVAMLLEIATTVGALCGATVAAHVPVDALAIAFALVLMYSAFSSSGSHDSVEQVAADPLAARLGLDSTYPAREGPRPYHVRRVRAGFGLMYVAGALSGLLGIGSGAMKVLAMDQVMRLPFKVATATSNFMIGVTAAAGAGVYLRRGYVDPGLVMPVALGVLAGSMIGARVLSGVRTALLRNLFTWVIFALAIEMLYEGLKGML